MAEILVKKRVCNACGADVRPDTQFCYNCGNSVASQRGVALKDESAIGKARTAETIAEEKNGDNAEQIENPAVGKVAVAPIAKSNVQTKTELKSAAALRRKSKVFQSKKVEVVWEEHENAPNGWFIIAAILLTLFAAGVFWLATYLK